MNSKLIADLNIFFLWTTYFKEALIQYNYAIEIKEDYLYYQNKAECLIFLNNYEDSLYFIEKSFKFNPGDLKTIEIYSKLLNAKFRDFWILEKGEHSQFFDEYPKEFEEKILDFINKNVL